MKPIYATTTFRPLAFVALLTLLPAGGGATTVHAPQASSIQQALPGGDKVDPLAALSTVDMKDKLSRLQHNCELAGLGRRFCAYMIDTILFFFLIGIFVKIIVSRCVSGIGISSEEKHAIQKALGKASLFRTEEQTLLIKKYIPTLTQKSLDNKMRLILILTNPVARLFMLIPKMGVTPGQWLLGLKVVDSQGKQLAPLGCAMLCLHDLISPISNTKFLGGLFIGDIISMLASKNKQTIGDMLAGSFVIRKRK